MYSVIQPSNKENRKLIGDAKRAYWVLFVLLIIELAIFALMVGLALSKVNWTYTAIVYPDYGVFVDQTMSWEYILITLGVIGSLLAIFMLAFVLMFWRKLSVIKILNLIFSILFALMVAIAMGVAIYLLVNANNVELPHNIFNDPFYCCAYYNEPTAACPNFGTNCNPPVDPAELGPNLPAVLEFVFLLFLFLLIVGINIIVVQFMSVPSFQKLLDAEEMLGYRSDLRRLDEPVTREREEPEAGLLKEDRTSPSDADSADFETNSSAGRKSSARMPIIRFTLPRKLD